MPEKFKSRKFLTAAAGVIIGAVMVFGIDMGTVADIAGIVTTLASIVVYIITEGGIDKAAVGKNGAKVSEDEKTDKETD